jgi:hypothetical protein
MISNSENKSREEIVKFVVINYKKHLRKIKLAKIDFIPLFPFRLQGAVSTATDRPTDRSIDHTATLPVSGKMEKDITATINSHLHRKFFP